MSSRPNARASAAGWLASKLASSQLRPPLSAEEARLKAEEEARLKAAEEARLKAAAASSSAAAASSLGRRLTRGALKYLSAEEAKEAAARLEKAAADPDTALAEAEVTEDPEDERLARLLTTKERLDAGEVSLLFFRKILVSRGEPLTEGPLRKLRGGFCPTWSEVSLEEFVRLLGFSLQELQVCGTVDAGRVAPYLGGLTGRSGTTYSFKTKTAIETIKDGKVVPRFRTYIGFTSVDFLARLLEHNDGSKTSLLTTRKSLPEVEWGAVYVDFTATNEATKKFRELFGTSLSPEACAALLEALLIRHAQPADSDVVNVRGRRDVFENLSKHKAIKPSDSFYAARVDDAVTLIQLHVTPADKDKHTRTLVKEGKLVQPGEKMPVEPFSADGLSVGHQSKAAKAAKAGAGEGEEEEEEAEDSDEEEVDSGERDDDKVVVIKRTTTGKPTKLKAAQEDEEEGGGASSSASSSSAASSAAHQGHQLGQGPA